MAYFDDNVYGVVYFIDISSLKPLGMGTISFAQSTLSS
jgi:hypothetical protein